METLTASTANISYPQEYSIRRCQACQQYHGQELCNLNQLRHILRNS